MTNIVYSDFELMEAAFRGTTPSAIRASNNRVNYSYTSSSSTSSGSGTSSTSSSGSGTSSPTSTPTHVNNSYYLHELSMTIKGGIQISLTEVMQYIEIYEDIFSKSIHGYIELKDVDGGLSKFMITGGEIIKMIFLKPLPSSEIIVNRDDLVVYNISKVEFDDQNTMNYKLYFMPKSAIIAQKKRIYKSFTNTRSIPSVISSIYSDIEGNSNIFTRTSGITTMQKSFLSPGYTPYEAIDILTKRASYSGDYFVFFERLNALGSNKHVFSSINNLRNYWTSEISGVPIILYQPVTSHIVPADADALHATYVQIQDNFDHINNMNSGFYNSRVRMLDITKRQFHDLTINYSEIQDTAGQSKFLDNNNIFLSYNHSYPEYPGERLVPRSYNDIFANKNVWIRTDVYGSIMLSNMRVNVDIPGGNNLIGAGNVVELKLPSAYAKSLNLEASITTDDEYYSGKYIVTAVKHTFDLTSYIKKIELSRDSGRINLGYAINNLSNVPPSSLSFTDRSRTPPIPPPPPPPPPPPEPYYYYDWGGSGGL